MRRMIGGDVSGDRTARPEIEEPKVADQGAEQHPGAVGAVAQTMHDVRRQDEADHHADHERGPVGNDIPERTPPAREALALGEGCHRVNSGWRKARVASRRRRSRRRHLWKASAPRSETLSRNGRSALTIVLKSSCTRCHSGSLPASSMNYVRG